MLLFHNDNMKNKQGILIATLLVAVLLIGGVYYMYVDRNETKEVASSITFPSGGETLVAGKTYTLKWNGSVSTVGTTTQIFLIDESLLPQGASVSIVDRIYNIADTGSYAYTVPTAVSDGTYFFVIGTTTSNHFTVTSSE